MPPHNLTEVVDATIALLKDPDIAVEGLTKIVTGPDFPTGGFIYGRDEIRKSYLEGRGILQLRARAESIALVAALRNAMRLSSLRFRSGQQSAFDRTYRRTRQ